MPCDLKAVILAGGRGKRMRPITDYTPKPLVPVCNVPILEWQFRHLRKFGISDVIVCTGYKTKMIEDMLHAKDHKIKVTVSAEDTPLGTGGAIKQASEYIGADDTFVVLNGDVITDIEISALAAVRNSVAVIPLRTNYGTLDIKLEPDRSDAAVTGFNEKGIIHEMWMNAGVYHLGRETLDDLPAVGDIERTLFPDYASRGMLRAVRFGEPSSCESNMACDTVMWQSIDSFKDLEACAEALADTG